MLSDNVIIIMLLCIIILLVLFFGVIFFKMSNTLENFSERVYDSSILNNIKTDKISIQQYDRNNLDKKNIEQLDLINSKPPNGSVPLKQTTKINDSEKNKQDIVCENDSVNYRFKEGKRDLQPHNISCSLETQGENDPQKYYKDKFKYLRPIMEPADILGSNYMNYNDNPNPYNIGDPLYDKTTIGKMPVGVNYQL